MDMTKNFVCVGGYIFCPDDVLYVIQQYDRNYNDDHSTIEWKSKIEFNNGTGLIVEETLFDEITKALINKNKDIKNDTNKG